MRCWSLLLAQCLLASLFSSAAWAGEGFDWDLWRELPVQNGGRQKPLDTLGWETLRSVANRGSLVDPQSQVRLDPTALYLTMLFDWQGWDHRDKDQLPSVMGLGPEGSLGAGGVVGLPGGAPRALCGLG